MSWNGVKERYSRNELIVRILIILIMCLIVFEAVCLSVLLGIYHYKGADTRSFFYDHLLTRPFAKEVVPGKKFIGNLGGGDDPNWIQIQMIDALLGWRLAPNVAALQYRRYLYVTDQNGFIADPEDAPVAVQKASDSYRVIVMGGSTVMGMGAPRPSDNLVGHLRKFVADAGLCGTTAKTVEIINAGIGGFHSGQEYLYLYSELLKYSPDLIVVYDGWNDSQYSNQLLARYPESHSSLLTLTHFAISQRINESFKPGGATVHLLSALGIVIGDLKRTIGVVELFTKSLQHFIVMTMGDTGNKHSAQKIYYKRSVHFYEENLRAILSLAKSRSLKVALFLQPLPGIDGKTFSPEEKVTAWDPMVEGGELSIRTSFYRDAREVFHKLASEFTLPQFCVKDISLMFQGLSDTVYVDSGHLSSHGNAIVAKTIMTELAGCGQLVQPKKFVANKPN